MLIQNIFERPIFRHINGVVKADQTDADSVWQELDEYVVTSELDGHLTKFFEAYLSSIDHYGDPDVVGKVGVWVSGFFGSGKSHFIKILSYLLANEKVTKGEITKEAIEFFDGKIQDAMLSGDMKRAVGTDVDVILFNIDSKADVTSGRDAILRVFLKAFNEKLGYSDHPHIAHMERYLAEQGKLDEFKSGFEAETGHIWEDERDAYQFHTDGLASSLSKVLGQDIKDPDAWIERFESDFSLTVENFSTWVKEYLDSKGPDRRIIFLVDEVGQFIGQETQLMLNLQTIVENLGTKCGGRAWAVVTSQEDIDAVVGDLTASKANDFSKIQGRFRTRLSLSSANVDEVIQRRLLSKTGTARTELAKLYGSTADILKNQLSFSNVGHTYKAYSGEDDFVNVYPFAPYQFQLLQKIFESIRRAGATGLHLARGERSMLDAYQSAAKQIAEEELGVLVPLYRFYPSIESFLEGIVKTTIDNAASNPALEDFDGLVLRTLFLIRYVEEIKGNVDNLTTLFIDRIDADRLAIKRKIEESLQRLEKQTLISRSGVNFAFLTNEERDISREIKNVEIGTGEEEKFIGELVFDDVLGGVRKHRFPDNNKDFPLTRLVDLHPHGTRTDGDLTVLVITPLGDGYEFYGDEKCRLDSGANNGQVIIKLDDDEALGREIRTYLRTQKFIQRKSDGTADTSTTRILRDRADENRERRERLVPVVRGLIAEGAFYAAGQSLTTKTESARGAVDEALNYLIRNTFNKLSYLKHLCTNPQAELRAILSSTDVTELNLDGEEGNPEALKEVLDYVTLMGSADKQVVLHDLVEEKFGRRPYGWPDWEAVLLVARLIVSGSVSLVMDGTTLSTDKIYNAVITPNKWRRITVMKRKTVDKGAIQKARNIAKDVFGKLAPDGEDALDAFVRDSFGGWQASLENHKALADTGEYPGSTEIADALGEIRKMLATKEAFDFITAFIDNKDGLLDLSDTVNELGDFYTQQRSTWDGLRKAYDGFKVNQHELDKDADAATALKRTAEILGHDAPYGMVKEADGLIRKVTEVNDRLLKTRREHALERIDGSIEKVKADLDAISASPELRNACLHPLQQIRQQVEQETSIGNIHQAQSRARDAADEAFDRIEAEQRRRASQPKSQPGAGGATPAATGSSPAPIKKRKVVSPSAFSSKPFLETEADVDEFLDKLRQELEAGIKNDERIEIR